MKVRLPSGELVDVDPSALLADDGTTPWTPEPVTPDPGTQYFTADDLARVRQEEKDKLYGRIENLNEELQGFREQIGSLTAAEQRRQAQAEDEKARLEEEARRKEAEELDAKSLIERRQQEWQEQLAQTNQTWEQRFAEGQQRREAAEATAQREREFADLRQYVQDQVAANQNKIAPQLLPWINGNSREEVDAAVARAIETTDQIVADLQQVQDPNQQIIQDPSQQQVVPQPWTPPAPPATPGTRVTTGPANDPASQYTQLTAEQIANMPMSEYAKLRPQLVGGQNQNNRGLYG